MISLAEIDWYHEILPRIDTVFDVGCGRDNVFYNMDPTLDIHLFDPRKMDGATMHGKFNNYALGSHTGQAEYHYEYSSLLHRDLVGEKWTALTHDTYPVQVDTLDNYCQREGITSIGLLKIDTEGWDLEVIKGAAGMLSNITYIQFEHWDDDRTGQIKELLTGWTVELLGGKPINYKCKNET